MNKIEVLLSDEELSLISGGTEVQIPIRVKEDDILLNLNKETITTPTCGKDDPGGNEDIFGSKR